MPESSKIQKELNAPLRNGHNLNEVVNPEDFLWNNKSNYDNYRDLLNNYNKNYVSFIGAGVSVSLGIKDWKGLLDDLAKVAKEQYDFNQAIPDDPKEWPVYAESIYNHLESNGAKEIYFDSISSGMKPRNNTTSLTLVKLAIALEEHLTTNFDRSLEYAYEFLLYLSRKFNRMEVSKEYDVHYVPEFGDYSKSQDKNIIYYLHGNVNKKIYIFKKSHYDIYYPTVSSSNECSHDLERLLDYYYRNRTILFIGFSFSDYLLIGVQK